MKYRETIHNIIKILKKEDIFNSIQNFDDLLHGMNLNPGDKISIIVENDKIYIKKMSSDKK